VSLEIRAKIAEIEGHEFAASAPGPR